jgi:cell wall-associated NlpC family hydrolase
VSIDAIAQALGANQIAQPAAAVFATAQALPAPTDPFDILLAAASEPAADQPADSLAAAAEPTGVANDLVALASSSPASTAAGAGSSGDAIVSEAAQFLGVPYVWGGSTPSGFDCSGLTQYVFSQLGVALPRTAAEQEQVGTPVATLAEAEPGDLLFFEPGQNGAPPGEAGHVAIYLGNDEMIAAPETGENVQVQTVPEEPLAIRRVNVPPDADAAAALETQAGSANSSVQMGNVAVPGQYASLIDAASATSGTPAPLLAAILYNESRFNPSAVSSAGAEGMAQFMPTTAAANGVDPFDPTSAITGAADLLSSYHAAFGSWSDAIAAYASGGGAVAAADGVPSDGSTPSYVANALALAGMAPSS